MGDVILTVNELIGTNFIKKARLEKRPVGRAAARFKQIKYKNIISAFDIETTRIEEIGQSVMYMWQWHIMGLGTIIGRTWNDYRKMHMWICGQLDDNERMVAYVHWLTHEFQYIKGIYNFTNEDIFSIGKRKIAKFTMSNKVEYRCSYLLSNQGLDEWLKSMGTEHQKIEGYDYDKRRYSNTDITIDELKYSVNDVVGLCEAVQKMMESEGDTLYTIPMTSTGYIRRDIKRALHEYSRLNRDIYYITPQLLQLAMQTFRGGDVGVSRFYEGLKLDNIDIYQDDRSSAYPSEIAEKEYPVTPWIRYNNVNYGDIETLINRRKAILMKVELRKVKLKDNKKCNPYIPVGKCLEYDSDSDIYNGRIIESSRIVIGITDIDYLIINDIYTYDKITSKVIECYCSNYGKLPNELINVFINYYVIKTHDKGVEKYKTAYEMAKRKFNAGYGNMVQNPLNDKYIYNSNEKTIKSEDDSLQEACARYNRQAYLSYMWGVWTTCHARMELHIGLQLVGDKYAIYWDTDGIIHCNPDIHVFDSYNEDKKNEAIENKFYAQDCNGVIHYGGVYERKERKIKKFKSLGQKKYVIEYEDGIEITISGVNKEKGAEELQEKGGIDNWDVGTEFIKAGGRTFYYNDNINMDYINENGDTIRITDNIYTEPSTFKMTSNGSYQDVLSNAKTIKRIYRQMNKNML